MKKKKARWKVHCIQTYIAMVTVQARTLPSSQSAHGKCSCDASKAKQTYINSATLQDPPVVAHAAAEHSSGVLGLGVQVTPFPLLCWEKHLHREKEREGSTTNKQLHSLTRRMQPKEAHFSPASVLIPDAVPNF